MSQLSVVSCPFQKAIAIDAKTGVGLALSN